MKINNFKYSIVYYHLKHHCLSFHSDILNNNALKYQRKKKKKGMIWYHKYFVFAVEISLMVSLVH